MLGIYVGKLPEVHCTLTPEEQWFLYDKYGENGMFYDDYMTDDPDYVQK